jgi:hypothetical protein
MGTAKQRRNSTRAKRLASSSRRSGTPKDVERLGDRTLCVQCPVVEIIERERRNLQRARALLDCLRIAAMYDYEEEVEPWDVAYVVSGLVNGAVNALDLVELQKAARQHPPEPP